MQFSTILTILVAVAAVEAVPRRGGGIRPGKGGSSGGGSSGGGSIGGGSSGAINNAAKSEKANQKLSAIEGLSLAIDTVGLAVALKDTFSGNPDKCAALDRGIDEVGCSKDGWCWKPCNAQNPTWWAWTSKTLGQVDYNTCTTDQDCINAGSNEISADGCGC